VVSSEALSSSDSHTTQALPTSAIVTVFRSRLRPGSEPEYQTLARKMEGIARAMPGFVDFKTFTSADGERVSVVVFANTDTHNAWRDHPEHRAAQQVGRDRLYSSCHIAVCALVSERRLDAPQD